MKPLFVKLQAFGPFARQQVIDFRELGDKNFFLIHGPTGSGKTSILDGICFALFGDSSGGEREGHEMRSHHADSDTLTEVSFDFLLGTERYRVRRVPEQNRKAKRGDGDTKQLQKADLWRIEMVDGQETEKAIATGWTKVTDRVEELLGFKSQQFRQVIMLPQGKFREFLMSNSQDREKILQTLFGTELYKRIEDALKLASKQVLEESKKVRTQRQTLLDQAQVDNEDLLDARKRQLEQAFAALQEEERKSTAAAQDAETALAEARVVGTSFEEFDKAVAAHKGLSDEQPAWNDRRTKLSEARLAASIQPYEVALTEISKQLDDEVCRGKKFAGDVTTDSTKKKEADAALNRETARAPEAEKLTARLSELDALVDKVLSLATVRTDHRNASEESSRAETSLQASRQALEAATEVEKTLVNDIQSRKLMVATLEGQKGTLARLISQLDQANALDSRTRELAASAAQVDRLTLALESATANCTDARARRDTMHRTWVAGQAARLARELVEDQPCPVCGSLDHPAPAHMDGALVLDATLKAAEDTLVKADDSHRAAEVKLLSEQQNGRVLQERIAELETTLGDAAGTPIESFRTQSDAAQLALNQIGAAAKELQTFESKLPDAKLAVQSAGTALSSALLSEKQAQTKLQQLVGQLSEREAGIPAELADPKALESARATAVKARGALKLALETTTEAARFAANKLMQTNTRLQESEQVSQRIAEQQRQKSVDLEHRLKAANFVDLTACRKACLDGAAITALDKDIRTFDAFLAAASERQSRAVTNTMGLVRPDLDALVLIHAEAKAAQLAGSNAVRDTLSILNATTDFLDSLNKFADSFKTIEARYAVLKKVADVANGTVVNSHKISFQRYVLGTLLDEVLAATTIRLRIMSRGRYEMRRKIEQVNLKTVSGLDLEIFDQYTGTNRPVSTLSGGESFLASLALALGLSDVVQSYAGGIRLDAIFVDEGFGTLDPEALDFAILALKDLQQAGRMVGIISHVAELKECIDARLELSATQTGSTAQFVV